MDFSGYICNYDCNNTASACYGSVFGGGGSSVGHIVAGVFGQNVTFAFNNTMHVEGLFMQNTPAAPAVPAPFTVAWANIGAVPAGYSVLVLS